MKLIGVHMHIGSGVDYQHLERVCDAMVQQVIALGQDISAISAGGGGIVDSFPVWKISD